MKHSKHLLLLLLALAGLAVGLPAPAQTGLDLETAQKLTDALESLKTYTVGQENAPLDFIVTQVMAVQGRPVQRAELAARLAALLTPETTFDGKRFVIHQLQVIGAEEQLPVLAPMLIDESLSHLARYALQAMPGEAVDAALIDALGKTAGKVKIGLINTIAARHNPAHLEVITPLFADPDPEIARAALEGAAEIGGAQALAALEAAVDTVPEALRPVAVDGCLRCAEAFRLAGDTAAAMPVYEKYYAESEAPHVRLAAFHGLAVSQGEAAAPLVAEALASNDPQSITAAMAYVRTVPGAAATEAFAAKLEALSPEFQAILIGALADRGDQAALPAILAALESPEEPVRLAAIDALGILGNASAIAPLAQFAAAAEGPSRDLARASLAKLPGRDISPTLIQNVLNAEAPLRAELLRALVERRAFGAVPLFMNETQNKDEKVRQEAFRGLGLVAGPDALPGMTALLVDAPSGDIRNEAESALIAAARRAPSPEEQVAALLDALKSAKSDDARASLVKVLGQVASPAGLDALRAAAKDEAPAVSAAAVEALASWPDAAPLDDLLALAKTPPAKSLQLPAIDAYIRLLRLPSERPAGDTVKRLEQVLKLNADAAVKQKVLAALSELKAPEALNLAERYLADAAVASEAAVAAERIRKRFYEVTASDNAGEAGNALDEDINTRWTSGRVEQPGMWFQLDMSREATIAGVVLDSSRSPQDFPRGYEVYTFTDPAQPGNPVAAGAGDNAVTEIRFDPVKARYLKIVQTGATESYFWSIHELRLILE